MSILQSIKFLFMSSQAKADYVKRQVEGLTVDQLSNKSDTVFKYIDDGFSLTTNVGERFYRWRDIEAITAYKADLITYDDLRLDIDLGDVVLTLSEDLTGWSEFVEMLSKKLPGFLVDWESKVIQRPFAANLTLIYTKQVIK